VKSERKSEKSRVLVAWKKAARAGGISVVMGVGWGI
jgi:hypothetical protein